MATGDYALTLPQIKRAAELYADGLSRRQIAAFFDVSETAVRSALRLSGVKFRDRQVAAVAGLRRWVRDERAALAACGIVTVGPFENARRARSARGVIK